MSSPPHKVIDTVMTHPASRTRVIRGTLATARIGAGFTPNLPKTC